MAHSDAFATQFTSASDQSGHTSRRRSVAVECNGATPDPGGVALYLAAKRPLDRARKRSRPVRVTVAPPKTSAAKRHAWFHHANNQDWSHISPACCTVAAASTYRWETHRADCRLRILPPRGLAAQRPVSRKHLTQMIAVLALTANSSAAARREAPLSTSAITRADACPRNKPSASPTLPKANQCR